MTGRIAVVAVGLLLFSSAGRHFSAAEPDGSGSKGRAVIILDATSFWRMNHATRAPVADVDGSLKGLEVTCADKWESKAWDAILGSESGTPPPDWMKPDFDDGNWVRGPVRRACRTPFLERLCLRARFTVTDPEEVKGLALSVDYHGGAAVYVNGQEVARGHLPAGAALAEAYPLEAFVAEDGNLLTLRGDQALWKQQPAAEVAKRLESRVRKLSVLIPEKAIRRGTNVVAIELVRAPYHKAVAEQMPISRNHGPHKVYELSWNTCEIRTVRLAAAAADGLVGNAARPEGFQVWNSDPLATDYDLDFGDQAEPLRPIRLVGARNGTYSGKVVVGSSRPIRDIAATAGDLKGDGATIPASQVRIRYGMPWGDVALTNLGNNETIPYPAEVTPLLALYESPPQEVPVYSNEASARCLAIPEQPEPAFGAVLPIWVTVTVPKDAAPGLYSGQVAIQVQGRKLADVPVQVNVAAWTLPDPRDYRTWVELVQSPDTLAAEYGVSPWSDEHWRMIEKSMRFLAEVGSAVVYVPLIAETNIGNEQSMVRWIRKGENEYQYDFSIMDRYLDLAAKHLGDPDAVVFNVWDRYLTRKGAKSRDYQMEYSLKIAAAGPLVTVVDPSTGKAENAFLPDLEDPASKAVWKPLFGQLRERMRKRGLEKAMMIGMCSDFWASKEQVEFFNEVTANLPWATAGHYAPKSMYDGLGECAYQSSFFGARFGFTASLHGWKGPKPHVLFERVAMDVFPVVRWRTLAETAITGNLRGVGRLGADMWRVIKDKSGARKIRACERFPRGDWGYLGINSSALAPGPDGAVSTLRFEALREGVQECEARILLEGALTDDASKQKLGEGLVDRCRQVLDDRHRAMWRGIALWQAGERYEHEATSWRGRPAPTGYTWYLGSNWQERSEKLYALAGEVEKKLGEP